MARDGLVPEVRTDRNGVAVRRWVRPRAAAVALVPPPSPPARGKAAAVAALATAAQSLLSLPDGVTRSLRDSATSYSEDTLQRVTEAALAGQIGVAGTAARMVIHQHPERALREFVAFAPDIDPAVRSSEVAEAAVQALHRYHETVVPPMDDLTLADEGTQAQCRALVAVAYGMTQLDAHLTQAALDEIDPAEEDDGEDYETEEPMPAIKDWGLIGLLKEHPEDAGDILTVIGERGFESADRLRELLYEGPRALSGGRL